MDEPKDINDLINQNNQNIQNSPNNYEDYETYNDYEDDSLDYDIMKFCVRKKLERDKKIYNTERKTFFDEKKNEINVNLNRIERIRNFWKKIFKK